LAGPLSSKPLGSPGHERRLSFSLAIRLSRGHIQAEGEYKVTTSPHPHEVLLQQIQQEFADILGETSQGIYIYQDDPHWICNDKRATILGYASARELMKLSSGSPILDAIVATDSHQRVVEAYLNAVNSKVATSIPVTWKKKGGGTVNTQTIFVPFSFKGNLLAIHFITPI
jgi:hypothetical protein